MAEQRVTLHDKTFVPYRPCSELYSDVLRVAQELSRDVASMTNPLALCVLNGAFVFAADLLRAVEQDFPVEFVRYASYEGTSSTGEVKQLMGLTHDVKGRDLIVIEDIVDSGLTMQHTIAHLKGLGAKRVHIATMFTKPEAFRGDFEVDYVGHALPNLFVVGYGLDYNGLGRTLPDLYILEG